MENLNQTFPRIPKSLEQSTRVFHGVRFDVNRIEKKTKSGKLALKDAVIHPGAVVILPLLDADTVVLIQNYRFAVEEVLWELPAGTLEPDEEPGQTAARELIEETGYAAEDLSLLTKFYTTPGICTEEMHAYVAKGLTFVGQQLDDSEEIAVFTFDWPSVMRMIKEGQIKDGKSLTTLLFYLQSKQD